MEGRVTLSLLEFDILWEHLRLGQFPAILEIDSHGATLDERAELATKAWTSLAGKGLGRPDAPDERLVDWLHRLATPAWELDARLHLSAGTRTSALFAWRDRWATAATLDATGLTLWATRTDRVAHEAVLLLPPHPPGAGSSITLPAATLDKAARSGGLLRALISAGLGKAEAHKIAEAWGGIVRFGQFGAAHTPAGAERRRAGHVVSVYDSAHRHLFTRKRDWVTLTPGTNAGAIRQLDEMLADLSPTTKALPFA